MPKPHAITGLDIGTGYIKILSAFKRPKEGDFEVLGQAKEISFGIRKGVVIDTHKVAEIISSLVKKVEEDTKQKINSVYASIDGGHIASTSSHGLVSVSRADRKISEEDIERVIQAAKTFSLPLNKEIIDIFPKEFIVDGEIGIKEAVGMEGVRLEADVIIIYCFSPYLKNSSRAILNSGLQINDLIPTPLASAWAVLTPREKELGVVVLDIGAGTTGMAVFEEGGLIDVAIFPIGSGHITNDIAICLKTDIDTAEKIKLEFGACYLSSSSGGKKSGRNDKKIKIEGEEPLVFSQKTLTEIIEARVCEMFDLVNKELKKISFQGLLPAGVVLTGGGAKLPGIKDLAKKELKLPGRKGIPREFPSLIDDSILSTLFGLIMHGAELEEGGGGLHLGKKIKKIFRIFIP